MLRVSLTYVLCLLLHSCYAIPFFFEQQPVDTVLQEKDEARLYCIVKPIPPGATYTWYKTDKTKLQESVIEGTLEPLAEFQSSVLHYPEVSRDATGYYYCKVETTNPPYKIFSRTAHVVVNYFDPPPETITETVTLTDNKQEAYLECDTATSFPETAVMWKKDGATIADDRMFVFPKDKFGEKLIKRGTLLIMNVDMDQDAGLYECVTVDQVADSSGGKKQLLLSSYQVKTTRGFDNPKDQPTIPVFKSYSESGGGIEIAPGQRVTLICAAKGYPTPTYSWFIVGESEEVAIRGSDSLLLEDNDKRLVASNIMMNIEFKCVMTNRAFGRNNDRQGNFYVTVTEADYSITVTQKPVQHHVLMPNQYTPFKLECYAEKTGQNQVDWLKDGEKLQWNARRPRVFKDKEIDGVTSEGSTVTFEIPNESDLGVYQCVIVNSERLVTETAFVTLEKDELPYEIDTRKPDYFYLSGQYHVDEAEEACNNRNAHLVSILDSEENDRVQQLAIQHNENATVWIGLTRENPDPIGTWVWTLSEDTATTFSNWEDDKPDNKYGAQEYAVLVPSNGKWVDVNKNDRRPAICKLYQVVCESVDKFYKGRVRVKGWERQGATYEVGQEVEVFCRFPGEKALSVTSVTCGENAKFTPENLDDQCPEVPSSASFLHISSVLLIITLSVGILRTS